MHGGIGRSINSVEQIEKLERPITMDAGSIILMDLLWCDLLTQLICVFGIYVQDFFVDNMVQIQV